MFFYSFITAHFFQIIGWVGFFISASTYYLVINKKVEPENKILLSFMFANDLANVLYAGMYLHDIPSLMKSLFFFCSTALAVGTRLLKLVQNQTNAKDVSHRSIKKFIQEETYPITSPKVKLV